MPVSDHLLVLEDEFHAKEGSFLIELRCGLNWDREAFSRLVGAMQAYVENRPASETTIERWIAEGFWHLDYFVKEWSSHPSFPRPYGDQYYEEAYERLHDLAYSLFVGESPYMDGKLPMSLNVS